MGLCFDPASGWFTPNHDSGTNTSQGKAYYTIVYNIFNYIQKFFNQHIVLYNMVKWLWILRKRGRINWMFSNILSDCDFFWTTEKRTDSSIVETIHVSRVHDSLKCPRNVTEQTNPLKVDNLITNKSSNLRSL
jgi:hypothetical protein